jgi:hypothetical protein
MSGRKPQDKQYCSIKCECGATHGQYLEHYQLLRTGCSRVYWALQPKRDGLFTLVLWPGDHIQPPPPINGEVARDWHRSRPAYS